MSAKTRSRISTRAGLSGSARKCGRAISWSARSRPRARLSSAPKRSCLRAIFGEKAGEVRDTSLRVPPGVEGAVIDARVFARRGVAKDDRTQEIQSLEAERLKQDEGEEIRIIRQETLRKLKNALAGKKLAGRVMSDERRVLFQKGDAISPEDLDDLPPPLWGQLKVENESTDWRIAQALAAMNANVEAVQNHYGAKIDRLKAGDELAPGVIKMIKVFVAIKRRLQVGDKMAGRHGNKGVLSRILPEEDMPRTEDGTPVDIVLESARRAVADERRADSGDPSWLGGARTRAAARTGIGQRGDADADSTAPARVLSRKGKSGIYRGSAGRRDDEACAEGGQGRAYRVAGFRRRARGRDLRAAQARRPARDRPVHAPRRAHRLGLRAAGHSRRDVHDEAASSGRGQDSRALDRTLQPGHAAAARAARPSSADSGSARWKCGRSKPMARPTRCRKC